MLRTLAGYLIRHFAVQCDGLAEIADIARQLESQSQAGGSSVDGQTAATAIRQAQPPPPGGRR